MSAPGIRVPADDVPVLMWLGQCTEDEATALERALDVQVSARRDVVSLAQRVHTIEEPTAEQLVDMLIGVTAFRLSHGQPIESVAVGVAKAHQLKLRDAERQELQRRLLRLMSTKSVLLTAKALDLQHDQQRNFHTCRIFTEMRPVFDEFKPQEPIGFVTYHVLKVEYFEAGEYRSLFVPMDDADLERLAASVNRAKEKGSGIERWIVAAGLPVVNEEVE
jgi:hypothetical protein